MTHQAPHYGAPGERRGGEREVEGGQARGVAGGQLGARGGDQDRQDGQGEAGSARGPHHRLQRAQGGEKQAQWQQEQDRRVN